MSDIANVPDPALLCPASNLESRICSFRSEIVISRYGGEAQLPAIMELMKRDLSEPYSVFTYRCELPSVSQSTAAPLFTSKHNATQTLLRVGQSSASWCVFRQGGCVFNQLWYCC